MQVSIVLHELKAITHPVRVCQGPPFEPRKTGFPNYTPALEHCYTSGKKMLSGSKTEWTT
eukprot:scaffold639231_cov42-Prasinocladus_malaysianus.AAC.1